MGEEEEYDEEELEFMADRSSEPNMGSDSFDDESYIPEETDIVDSSNEFIDENTEDEGSLENINYASEEPSPSKKTWVPLKKIPQTTWMHDGKWINTVYMVRPKENLATINEKLYGSEDRQEELKSVNPFLKRRQPKVGDKIYYNSSLRPKDRNQFLVYYEDQKQIPESYDIKQGENIREIASQLLGHKDSWKEIWATNLQVESKWNLNKDITIQYWPSK